MLKLVNAHSTNIRLLLQSCLWQPPQHHVQDTYLPTSVLQNVLSKHAQVTYRAHCQCGKRCCASVNANYRYCNTLSAILPQICECAAKSKVSFRISAKHPEVFSRGTMTSSEAVPKSGTTSKSSLMVTTCQDRMLDSPSSTSCLPSFVSH